LRHATTVGERQNLLIGDLNTTRHYIDEDGRVVQGDHYLVSLENAGWREAFRLAHPDRREFSWYSNAGNGFRIDQAWLSPALVPRLKDARFDHSVRESGYSDHSMLLVDLEG
jgi:exonuclease III